MAIFDVGIYRLKEHRVKQKNGINFKFLRIGLFNFNRLKFYPITLCVWKPPTKGLYLPGNNRQQEISLFDPLTSPYKKIKIDLLDVSNRQPLWNDSGIQTGLIARPILNNMCWNVDLMISQNHNPWLKVKFWLNHRKI